MPDWVVHDILEDGQLSEPVEQDAMSKGMVREVDLGIVIDVETARAVSAWLINMVKAVETKWPDHISDEGGEGV